MAGPLPKRLRDLALNTRVIWAIIAVNLLGMLFGFYYYLPQLKQTSLPLWIFVIDSPLSTLLIALSLLFHARGHKSSIVDMFAFVSNVKYGLWTVFVLIFYFNSFWSVNSPGMYLFLLSSHFLMFVQAFLVLEYTDFSLKALLLSTAWFIVNDTFDYVLDIHPWLFVEHSHPVSPAMISAYALTFVGLGIYALYWHSTDELSFFNISVNK